MRAGEVARHLAGEDQVNLGSVQPAMTRLQVELQGWTDASFVSRTATIHGRVYLPMAFNVYRSHTQAQPQL